MYATGYGWANFVETSTLTTLFYTWSAFLVVTLCKVHKYIQFQIIFDVLMISPIISFALAAIQSIQSIFPRTSIIHVTVSLSAGEDSQRTLSEYTIATDRPSSRGHRTPRSKRSRSLERPSSSSRARSAASHHDSDVYVTSAAYRPPSEMR